MTVIPAILSGGTGTRLWPLSRRSKPKQFLSFGGAHTLFQDTVLRCRSAVFESTPIVVGADEHRFMLAEDLLEIGVKADILLEPMPRNSCAAIAAACMQAMGRSKDAMVLVLAADHAIPDAEAFSAAVAQAAVDAAQGYLVTFGIRPTRPATSYGYILPGKPLDEGAMVERFVEKPTRDRAETYLRQGYLWNSGNFLFRADVLLEELRRYEPAIADAVGRAFAARTADLDFLRLEREAFAGAPSISFDYAVMERTEKAAVLPVDYAWSDVGSWDAIAHVVPGDAEGNVLIGDARPVDSRNNVVHSRGRLTTLIGVTDTIVVSTRDAVLVADKAHAEGVKSLVDALKQDGRSEANEALQIFRPWGNYEQLDVGAGYQVKRITVKPGGVLSLQKHRHRSEHWVVVEGQAEVTVGDRIETVNPNQSVYVPLGAVHRLANRGTTPTVLIEVQTGDYLGEDDIVRLEDTYNRGATHGDSGS